LAAAAAGAMIRPVRAIVLLAPLVAFACGTRASEVSKPAAAAVAWRQLGSWSGRGNAQTESFTSDTGTLRVRWEAKASSGQNARDSASFHVDAHSAISGRLLQPVVDHAGPGEGVGYVQQDPHVLYIVVESKDLAWTVTVEEAVAY
jgi:hypothetical protein